MNKQLRTGMVGSLLALVSMYTGLASGKISDTFEIHDNESDHLESFPKSHSNIVRDVVCENIRVGNYAASIIRIPFHNILESKGNF